MAAHHPRHAAPDDACRDGRSHRRRRLSVGLLGAGALGLIGTGALASWTTTSQTASGTISAATAAVALVDANNTTLTSQVSDLLPGDYFYRYVDLRNDGTSSTAFSGLLTATGDLTGALTAQVDRCSISWSSSGTCLGAITSQAPETVVDQTGTSVTYGNIGNGLAGIAHERYRIKLADTAPASLQGKTGTLTISVSGATTGGRDRTNG